MNIHLRDVSETDLPIFFEQQLDPEANYMAAFTSKDPTDEVAFRIHWAKMRSDKTIVNKTIIVDGHIAGHIGCFGPAEEREITYWIGKPYWGRGIATAALQQLQLLVSTRPLRAQAAKDNHASLRVLQKCGFTIVGEDKGFANARGAETEEFILQTTRPPTRDVT